MLQAWKAPNKCFKLALLDGSWYATLAWSKATFCAGYLNRKSELESIASHSALCVGKLQVCHWHLYVKLENLERIGVHCCSACASQTMLSVAQSNLAV